VRFSGFGGVKAVKGAEVGKERKRRRRGRKEKRIWNLRSGMDRKENFLLVRNRSSVNQELTQGHAKWQNPKWRSSTLLTRVTRP
jgi:hypothetical protein